jgi:uncharacterized protein involved in type VI secretion and phage assembly
MTQLYFAKVVDAEDDADKTSARINVKLHGFDGDPVIRKVRLLTFGAGAETGMVWIPQTGDEVVVAQLGGPQEWVALGSLYNSTNAPLYSNDDGDNTERVFTTPSGSELRFSDVEGEEFIRLATKEGTELLMSAESGSEKITITSKTDVTIEATGGIVELTAGGDLKVTVKGKTTIKSTGALSIEGSADVTVKAGAALNLKGGSAVNVSGPAINLG